MSCSTKEAQVKYQLYQAEEAMTTNERLREIRGYPQLDPQSEYYEDYAAFLLARLDEVVKLAREFADCKWQDLYRAETALRRCLAELEKGE